MNRARLHRILAWLAPVAAVVVVLAVLRGAGVPFTLPIIAIVLVILLLLRVVIGRWRRRRRHHRVTSPSRSR